MLSSGFRYEKTNELLNKLDIENCKLSDITDILNYKTYDYYKTIHKDYVKFNDKSSTIAMFAHDTTSDEIVIEDYIGLSRIVLSKNGEIRETKSL